MGELERIAETFGHWERDEYLAYIWHTEFTEWDKNATTDEAIMRANEAQQRAETAWDEIHGR